MIRHPQIIATDKAMCFLFTTTPHLFLNYSKTYATPAKSFVVNNLQRKCMNAAEKAVIRGRISAFAQGMAQAGQAGLI